MLLRDGRTSRKSFIWAKWLDRDPSGQLYVQFLCGSSLKFVRFEFKLTKVERQANSQFGGPHFLVCHRLLPVLMCPLNPINGSIGLPTPNVILGQSFWCRAVGVFEMNT